MASPKPAQNQLPHLRATKASSQLVVHGEPFLMLAGELHNSSLSSAKYMSTVYADMKYMNINTLLGSVTWEMIEPTEGIFDFSELDAILVGARENGMKLVLLWFGSFKNALSTYVPGWVKRNVKRFPRVHVYDDDKKLKTIELLSPFVEECWTADMRAFSRLMSHLKEVDGVNNTVIMVQVENETGLLGDSRDRSRIASQRYTEPVPSDLLEYLKAAGTLHPAFLKQWPGFQKHVKNFRNDPSWEEVFGEGSAAEEVFMADAFARYVAKVAEAGRKEYDIPLYTNCWLNMDDPAHLDLTGISSTDGAPAVAGGGARPGVYPSGGPVPHLFDIWNCHCIHRDRLDFISPDLYLHDYEYILQQYRYLKNPLFIPEQKADLAGARRTWLAYGTYGAMGCSPFGIDTICMDETEKEGWRRTYGLLRSMSKVIVDFQAQRPEDMMGFYFDDPSHTTHYRKDRWTRIFEDIQMEVIVERSFVFGKPSPGYGIVIHQGNGKFLLIGAGFQTTFRSTNPRSTFTGILSSAEKEADEVGNLTTLRTMNGDETRSGACMIMPTERPDYGGFPIRITIPARTYIAEIVAYSLEEECSQ